MGECTQSKAARCTRSTRKDAGEAERAWRASVPIRVPAGLRRGGSLTGGDRPFAPPTASTHPAGLSVRPTTQLVKGGGQTPRSPAGPEDSRAGAQWGSRPNRREVVSAGAQTRGAPGGANKIKSRSNETNLPSRFHCKTGEPMPRAPFSPQSCPLPSALRWLAGSPREAGPPTPGVPTGPGIITPASRLPPPPTNIPPAPLISARPLQLQPEPAAAVPSTVTAHGLTQRSRPEPSSM